MNKQQSNEMSSIRKKLLAAIAMLLVACVMTVSSTYAWFTLSTAPEVKGITTTVGANGNLEIALGTYDTVYGGVTPSSGEGDSMDKVGKLVTDANITWGNLIDLSDESYGLGKVVLYPARLNVTGNAISMLSPLSFPKYGSDGRIMELVADTLLGQYVGGSTNGFMAKDPLDYAGVNAIGSASSMTKREFAVRNNRNTIESKRVAAMAEAQGAINLYSGDLAAIAINNMSDNDEATITADEAAILNALIVKLETSNAAIGESIKAAIMLAVASDNGIFENDDAWETFATPLASEDLQGVLDAIDTLSGGLSISGIDDLVSKHNAITSDLASAKSAMTTAAADDVYEWSEVKTAVNALLNASGIKICNETISDIKATKDSEEEDTAFGRVTSAALSGGLEFQFSSTSGVFADIAEMTGAYSATITFPEGLKVEGIPLGGLKRPVEVQSASSDSDGELGAVYDLTSSLAAPGAQDGAAKALTDTYGYTVDLLFRTNAADSYLQLQTAAANRIYEGSTNENIQGAGSNMSFTVGQEYDKAKIDGIAAGIRVVFCETLTGEILGVATLDTTGNNISGDQYKLDLKLMNYSFVDNKIIIDEAKADANITSLSANTPKRVTALVYLDGDVIDNSNVGIAANLNGKLNLQFSSSAELDPMDNNDLYNGAN